VLTAAIRAVEWPARNVKHDPLACSFIKPVCLQQAPSHGETLKVTGSLGYLAPALGGQVFAKEDH
jgi:hypothetical protein